MVELLALLARCLMLPMAWMLADSVTPGVEHHAPQSFVALIADASSEIVKLVRREENIQMVVLNADARPAD